MRLAERVARLGTETAFAVSARTAALAAEGHKVYYFNLGDLNFPTPRVVVEGAEKALAQGKTNYCPNAGIAELRTAMAQVTNATHGTDYALGNVAIQPGGKPVIGKFLLALMNPGDEVLYPNPGFPIYESMIQFHGGVAVPYGFVEGESNFALDLEGLEKSITDKTRLLILNDLQNPTGAECSPAELARLAELAIKHDLYVLSDEAYFDIRFEGDSQSIVSLPGMAERSVILYTFSKKFAMTGWRVGAALGPQDVIETIIQLNINDESCPNHFAQYGALAGVLGDQSEVLAMLDTLKQRRDLAVDLLNSMEGVSCYRPQATFYLYPNVTGAMAHKGMDYGQFHEGLLMETGVSVCTRLHFGSEMPGEAMRYLRMAYSGIDLDQIEEGLGKMKVWLEG